MAIYHYVNGVFFRDKETYISPFDLSVIRGYGVFDYVQLYKGQPFHLMDHLERLKWSAEQIEISLPKSLDTIANATYALIERNPLIDAGIRFMITGGMCSQDLLTPDSGFNFIMLFHPYTPQPDRYYREGMRAITTNILRSMPGVKTTNYIPAILAMKRARKAGFDDALYVNDRRELLEGTTCNLFFFKNGSLITADSTDIVKGVTRSILLRLAETHFPIEYRSLSLDEILSCQEAFLCSSVKDVVPLVQINDTKIGSGLPGPHSKKLRNLYRSYIKDYLSRGIGLQKHEMATC